MLALTPDDRARWKSVVSDFQCSLVPLHRAQDVKEAQQRVLDTAMQLMREVIVEWNASTDSCRLPPEVLAACFSFLSIKELFAATHVCRSWRATALASAQLWSTLKFDISRFARGGILSAAAERAGQLPLDITLPHIRSAHEEALGLALSRHMHHVRHLSCTFTETSAFLSRSAPMLESLALHARDALPVDLLGGQPGRLTTLNISYLRLPATCSALSSLTTLSASIGQHSGGHETLAHLFVVCPRLEHLALSELVDAHFEHLTADAPVHLHTLSLRTYSLDTSDLVRYLPLWAAANSRLSRIDLNMEFDVQDAAPVFEDVVVLHVSQGRDRATLSTTNARGRQCTLVLRYLSQCRYDSVSKLIAAVIADYSALLGQLRTLSAPVTVLDPLFDPPPELPALQSLSVIVQKWAPETTISQQMFYPDGHWDVFPCEQLAFLEDTAGMPLARIEILARSSSNTCSIGASDVQKLFATLESSLPPRTDENVVEVIVPGLRDHLTTGVALPSVQGYSIRLNEAAGNVHSLPV